MPTMSSRNSKALLLTGFLLASVSSGAPAADSQSLLRSISTQGGAQVRGIADAHNTQSWRGLPYAAAPVGDLRWRAPRDPAGWSGVRDASRFSAICPQLGSYFGAPDPATFGQPIGTEDCLYLNVWRPKSSAGELPVLFWIHGGSNVRGAGSELLYNGAHFARTANAVVVTLNYRLGSLGWLYNEALQEGDPKDDSGNYATLDLIKGLEWVRDNIAQFGGDPHNVTIAGQSAGCINAWGLLQSPLAEQLVDRMLCMSGLPNAYPKTLGERQSDAMIDALLVEKGLANDPAQAAALRASQGASWVRSFLRALPAADIVRQTPSPVVMGHFTDGHVIPRAGYVDLIVGGYHQVPMILGTTQDEGTYFAGELLGYYQPTHAQMWELVNHQPPATLSIDDIVKPERHASYRPAHRALSLGVDLTVDNICRYLRLLQADIYRYNFAWDDAPQPWREAFGAVHGMDLPFLFGNFPSAPQEDLLRFVSSTSNEQQRLALSRTFIRYIAQFMRTGNPNKAFDGLPEWHDWSNFWVFQKRLILDNTVESSAQNIWLSDVEDALDQLDEVERRQVLTVMAGQQVQLEKVEAADE